MKVIARDSVVYTQDRKSIMPTQVAQRSCSKVKKPSKRVVFYVPDTFDPDLHLPKELRHLADYARYLLHRINVGRVHLRRGNLLVHLKRDYLVEFIPKERFTAIRDALVESDVICVRKFCIKGEMSYRYRLMYPHNQRFSLVRPTTKRLIDQMNCVIPFIGNSGVSSKRSQLTNKLLSPPFTAHRFSKRPRLP
jgi:hypothetical protein